MENYKEEINKLRTRLNELENKINEPKFEVGKYYTCKFNNAIVNYKTTNGRSIEGYGITSTGQWRDSLAYEKEYLILSTESKITEALTKEAIKRGLVTGNYALFGTNKVKRLISSSDYKLRYFGFTVGADLLMDNNGIWAEVYKPKTIDEWADEFTTFHVSNTMPIIDSFKNFITENKFKLPE